MEEVRTIATKLPQTDFLKESLAMARTSSGGGFISVGGRGERLFMALRWGLEGRFLHSLYA